MTRTIRTAAAILLFAAFHLDPHHIAGVLPLGFFLAWVGARCGTLVTIVAHIANNTLAIIAVHSETLDVGYGTSEPMPWSWLPVSLVLAALATGMVVNRNLPLGPYLWFGASAVLLFLWMVSWRLRNEQQFTHFAQGAHAPPGAGISRPAPACCVRNAA